VKISGGNLVYSSADLDLGISEDLKHVSKDKKVEIKELKNKLDKMTKRSNQSLTESIFAFAKTIELKDDYTGKHVEDTVHFTTEICKVIGLPKEEVELIKQGAVLHDLGKIGISERILRKNSKLSKAEFAEIMKHPQIGADILRPIHFLHALIPLIFCHHERWDGKGYPSGLKGESIPIGARIISVADVYQALTSDRPYRKSYTKKQALKIIKDASGSQFDPKIVDAFLGIIKREKK